MTIIQKFITTIWKAPDHRETNYKWKAFGRMESQLKSNRPPKISATAIRHVGQTQENPSVTFTVILDPLANVRIDVHACKVRRNLIDALEKKTQEKTVYKKAQTSSAQLFQSLY